MTRDYDRLQRVVAQRSDPDRKTRRGLAEGRSYTQHDKAASFVQLAMDSVDTSYTETSKAAGAAAQDHIVRTGSNFCYEFQGSVMTNTHIRGYSDIDLLVLLPQFYRYDGNALTAARLNPSFAITHGTAALTRINEVLNAAPFSGNSNQLASQARNLIETTMHQIYSQCDTSGARSVKITNLHYHRDVDIVTCAWYEDLTSVISGRETQRGIQIYNKEKGTLDIVDYPFIKIERINTRGDETGDRLRRMIRFLKHCKESLASNSLLTSFDLSSICYAIPKEHYHLATDETIVRCLSIHLDNLCGDRNFRRNLLSVDGREHIFTDDTKLPSLVDLQAEVSAIYQDLTGRANELY